MIEPDTPSAVTPLFCDEAILVIDKPAGLPVHSSARYLVGTVVGRLSEQYGVGFAAPVHRLDRETSGVLVCARHRRAAAWLSRAFQHGRVRKEYLAICEGDPGVDAFSVDAPLAVGGHVVRIGVRVDAVLGKPATTHFVLVRRLLRGGSPFTLWRVMPATGRRHQIRAHLREAGLSVVGDKIYGPDENYYVRFAESTLTPSDWQRLRLPRQALHAWRISFVHPITGECVCFEAPLPPDLRTFLRSDAEALAEQKG